MNQFERQRDLYVMEKLKDAAVLAMLVFISACAAIGLVLLTTQTIELRSQNRVLNTAIHNQQTADARQQKSDAATLRQINNQATQTKQTIQCIGDFFAQPNRQNMTIANLQQCQFNTSAFSPTAAIVPKQTKVPAAKEPTTSEPPNNPMPSSSTAAQSGQSSNGGSGVASPPGFLGQAVQDVVNLPRSIIHAMTGIL